MLKDQRGVNLKTEQATYDNARGRRDFLAICVPCYNESMTIGAVIDDFAAAYPNAAIYVYDNNSTDDTARIAREHGAIVRFEPRQGKGNVVRQMLRDIDADYYLLIDGDNAFSTQDAPKLLEPVMENRADMVIGDRLTSGIYAERNQRKWHGFGNGLVKQLIKWIYKVKIHDVMTGYRAFNRAFAKTFPILSTGFELETEMTIHAIDKNFRITQIPVEFKERPEGSISTLNTFRDGLKVLGTIFRLFKDYRPLSFFALIGALFCLAGLGYGIMVILEFLRIGMVNMVSTAVLAVALFIVGLLSITSGLILDTVVKASRKQFEAEIQRYYGER
jgi:glycosyltransferase involved in cell wall biosynthesis